MTPDEMRRAAVLLTSEASAIPICTVWSKTRYDEMIALAAKLRALADETERRENWTKQEHD